MSKKIALLAFVLVLLSMFGTRLVLTASGSTTHHVYPGDSIQEVINSAQSGDTIFVHFGTYYERVVINKTVSLIGEDKYTTIIDGNGTGNVIAITANNVNVSGFTAQNSGTTLNLRSGIYVAGSSGNNITDNFLMNNMRGITIDCWYNGKSEIWDNFVANNIVFNNSWGIALVGYSSSMQCHDNIITGNNVTNNLVPGYQGNLGILLHYSDNNIITDNIITNNHAGIIFEFSSNNTFSNNIISNHTSTGISIKSMWGWEIYSVDNTLTNNNISFNSYGVYINQHVYNNTICHNNFMNNTQHVYISGSGYHNYWDDGVKGNYWSDYGERYPNATEIDGSGIWDTPYEIDQDNVDRYPIVPEFPLFLILPLFILSTLLAVIVYSKKTSKSRKLQWPHKS